MAHIRQPRSNSGLIVQVKALKRGETPQPQPPNLQQRARTGTEWSCTHSKGRVQEQLHVFGVGV